MKPSVTMMLSEEGTRLEVKTALFSDAASKLFPALEQAGVVSMSNFLVRTDNKLILHAKLSEKNGTALSEERAVEAMQVVQSQMGAL
jgi:hypothetical protein